jgi:hypothetical protein
MPGSEMKLMPYSNLGAKEISENKIHFGILLPGISERDYSIWVRIIHEDDQFLQEIPTVDFEIKKDYTDQDYWSADVDIDARDKPHTNSQWGSPGQYIYRLRLRSQDDKIDIDFIGDPFAREFGKGKLSAFTLGYRRHNWSEEEKNWITPSLEEMPQFKTGEYYFYNQYDNYLSKNILLFHRLYQNRCTMVALNFGDWEQSVPVRFPLPGDYTELLAGLESLDNIETGKEYWLKIPSNCRGSTRIPGTPSIFPDTRSPIFS